MSYLSRLLLVYPPIGAETAVLANLRKHFRTFLKHCDSYSFPESPRMLSKKIAEEIVAKSLLNQSGNQAFNSHE